MSILVYVSTGQNGAIDEALKAVTAANACGGDVNLLLVGGVAIRVAAETAKSINGVTRVICVEGEAYENATSEVLAQIVFQIANEFNCSHILAVANSSVKSFMPRVAALLDVVQTSEVCAVISPDTFVRPIYAGNALATVKVLDTVKVLTVRATSFESPIRISASAEVLDRVLKINSANSEFISQSISQSERPDLTAARVVISGGRGMGSAENFNILNTLADHLGAAVGASRAAVDAGFAANDLQVGQTGKIVAPELYIAVGISGAIQHLAGMKESKVIVCVNKDEDAPIFQVADYGLVGDLFHAIPELTSELKQH